MKSSSSCETQNVNANVNCLKICLENEIWKMNCPMHVDNVSIHHLVMLDFYFVICYH